MLLLIFNEIYVLKALRFSKKHARLCGRGQTSYALNVIRHALRNFSKTLLYTEWIFNKNRRLIVHPNYQNKGIGTKLINQIEKYFEDEKINKYELFTGEKSQKNIYLYQKLGYKIFKTEKLSENVNIIYLEKENGRHGI